MGILVDPIKCFPSHPSEEILEEYIFNRLSAVRTAQVEEHLLICQNCQDAVAETERFVSALKVATRQPVPPIGPVRSAWRNGPKALRHFAPRTSLAPALALVILALVVVWQHPQEASAPIAVSLSSLRGTNPLSPAPAGKLLQLHIDAPDLLSSREYGVQVVDSTGRPVWKGAVSDIDGKLVATMSKPLADGVYWVRLYGTNSELLREFGLSAK
jgi:hypothetical protein